MRENQFSTWFSHDEYVGVKCMRTLPCCTRKSRTRWVLWLLTLSQMTWISCRSHWLATMSVRKATNCSLVWRAAVLPSTWPVAVFSAANKLSVPFLLYSNPWLSARPGASGSIRSLRSSDWMGGLSSTQKNTAWRERRHAVLAIERLDGGLLIDAKHHGVRRWIEVQPDPIGRLGLEVRVVGHHVSIQSLRSHVVLAPDALTRRNGYVAKFSRQLVAAPVRGAIARLAPERVVEHPRLQFGRRLLGRASRVPGVHARQALAEKAAGPAGDETRVAFEPLHDGVARLTLFEHEDQLGPAHVPHARRAGTGGRQ